MQLSEHAEKYVSENGLRSRMIASNCRRFERLTGIVNAEQVSLPVLQAFRSACMTMRLSNVTTEKTVTDVMTIVRYVVGTIPAVGKRLRQPRPEPRPVSLSDLDAIFAASESHRMRRWLCLTYWTGLRLADSVNLLTQSLPDITIRHKASKTGICHAWPVPEWLRPWLQRSDDRVTCRVPWMSRVIRAELAATCVVAGVAIVTPKNIRQASITEWTRSNATAGAIIHGCGLGVLSHYIDPLSVLESAAPRVRLPSCFGATDATGEESLLASFRRLDPAAQGLISGTAERLASG